MSVKRRYTTSICIHESSFLLSWSNTGTKPSLFVKKFEQYLTTKDVELLSELKEGYDGIEPIHYIRCLSLLAAKHRVWLSVGGFPEIVRSDITYPSSSSSPSSSTATGRIYNTHLMIDPCGEVVCPAYRKLHLFDSPLAGLKESELTAAGDRAVLLENIFEQWTLAPTICYDLRFPLLYEGFSSKGGYFFQIVHSKAICQAPLHYVCLLSLQGRISSWSHQHSLLQRGERIGRCCCERGR